MKWVDIPILLLIVIKVPADKTLLEPRMNTLTDLEAAVLAKIAREGSVTSYGIAKEFSNSMSEFWSGSAGAIYPATRRLVTRGFIDASRPDDGRHARTEYRVSRSGRSALKKWLLDVKRASGLGFDPLRSRLVNIELVTERERRSFLDAVEAEVVRAASVEPVTDSPQLSQIHATVMKARLDWIRAVRSVLG
jgi:DNA-binding PadR family transcriptional regulator